MKVIEERDNKNRYANILWNYNNILGDNLCGFLCSAGQ